MSQAWDPIKAVDELIACEDEEWQGDENQACGCHPEYLTTYGKCPDCMTKLDILRNFLLDRGFE